MKEYCGKVISNKKLPGGFYILSVRLGQALKNPVQPGQFAMVGRKERQGTILRRPYSIFDFSSNGKNTILKFFYKVLGQGTKDLSMASKGEDISLLAPLGKGFDYKTGSNRLLCIVTGGMGMVPFHLLMKSFKQYKSKKIMIFYGAKNKDELFYYKLFSKSVKTVFVSTDDGSKGYKGFISELFRDKLSEGKEFRRFKPKDMVVYTCGPRKMMGTIAQICEEAGMECYVSMEEVMGCGFGVCLSCAVKSMKSDEYLAVCKDGPVFDSRLIRI